MTATKLSRGAIVGLVFTLTTVIGFKVIQRNFIHLQLLLTHTRGVEPPQIEAQHGRVAGGLKLAEGKPIEAEKELKRYLEQIQPKDQAASHLLASAYMQQNKWLEAGFVLEQAGLLDEIAKIKQRPIINRESDKQRAFEFQNAIVALAANSLKNNDFSRAVQQAERAWRLTNEPKPNSEAMRIIAESKAKALDFRSAVVFMQRSIDISPLETVSDFRMKKIEEWSTSIVQTNDCVSDNENLRFALIVFYLNPHGSLSTNCRQKLIESLLQLVPSERRMYLFLHQAIEAKQQGNNVESNEYFREAEKLGLSKAWQIAYSDGISPSSTQNIQPSFLIDDQEFTGFEVDPYQIELGLPLDMVLFHHAQNSGKSSLLKFQAINLAPNAGFEWAEGCAVEDCLLYSFERDIYGAKQGSRRIIQAKRPNRMSEKSEAETSVLELGSVSNDIQSTGLSSFYRVLNIKAIEGLYLQAGWIRSKEGNGYVGRQWEERPIDGSYEYIAAEISKDGWSHFSKVFDNKTRKKSSVRIWLLNPLSRGIVHFDDVLLIRIR